MRNIIKTTIEVEHTEDIQVGVRQNSTYIPDDFDMKIKNLDTMLAIANSCSTPRDVSIFAWMCKKMNKQNMVTFGIADMISKIGLNNKNKSVSKRTLQKLFERMIDAELIVRLSDGKRNGIYEFMINPYLVLKHKSVNKELYFNNRMLWADYHMVGKITIKH